MKPTYIVQTSRGAKYEALFQAAISGVEYRRLDVAVAYATIGGVRALEKMLTVAIGDDRWQAIKKRWLIGIDWCRTDPPALRRLAAMPNSEVRVPDGKRLIKSTGCVPRDTFHLKLFVLDGAVHTAIICGSGNLSANGLGRGCECGSAWVTEAKRRSQPEETKSIVKWFAVAWKDAARLKDIYDGYARIVRATVRKRRAAPTEDDTRPPDLPRTSHRKSLTEEQIRQLRSFDNFWIDAGPLGANLGHGIPGNQLDMKRFTRAFFGARVEDVKANTEIDKITLIWGKQINEARTLRFGDNGMDKLNVPPAGRRGVLFYRGKTLLFSRRADGAFSFEVGDAKMRAKWMKRSRKQGVVHRLSSQRQWGLF